MSWFLVGGAALGAGVGSYGHDNWGWNKDAIWQGALVGGAGGYMAGASASAAPATSSITGSTAATKTTMGGVGLEGAKVGVSGLPIAGTQTGAGGSLGGFLTKPLVPGLAFSNPLMLGAAGLALASGGAGQGSSFQDKISLSPEGEALQKEYFKTAKGQMEKAKAGNVSDKAFQDISNLKSAEGLRSRTTQGSINTVQANIGNQPKDSRGRGVVGGQFVKAQLADAGERMTGLFAPTSTLNLYRKEELLNATKNIQNLSNIDNQTAAFSYASSLSKWNASQVLSSQKGAAIGSVAAMMGGAQLSRAYSEQMKIA